MFKKLKMIKCLKLKSNFNNKNMHIVKKIKIQNCVYMHTLQNSTNGIPTKRLNFTAK